MFVSPYISVGINLIKVLHPSLIYVNINDKTFVKRVVKMEGQTSDILIVGSGIAALQTAIYAQKKHKVTLITKTDMRTCNSYLAQGGIAAVYHSLDSVQSHIQDTLVAGCYHNDYDAVYHLVKEGPSVIDILIKNGMPFDRDENDDLIYGLEGAHSYRRILHSNGDCTGRVLTDFLLTKVQKMGVHIIENEMVIDILLDQKGRCMGVSTKDFEECTRNYFSSKVIVATGGCGQLYPFTTNSINATGDGIALAVRAGAKVADMEFIQFHPTGLYIHGRVVGLVSEAVRGEGGILVNDTGKRIMADALPYRDLSPRHVVSEKIFSEIEKGNCVYLDIRSIKDFHIHFPMITSICEENGLDWSEGFLPVAPASHFMMGGIWVNKEGETSISGLYAVGEVAYTGVHGANRLASNSLLEGLVYGKTVGTTIAESESTLLSLDVENTRHIKLKPFKLPSVEQIQNKMFQYAGIYRTREGLNTLKNWLEQLNIEQYKYISLEDCTRNEIQRIFMLLAAYKIVEAAIKRPQTCGAHIRKDEDMSFRVKHSFIGK